MALSPAILDAVSYFCRSWKVTPSQRLVASWSDGWHGGLGETKRRSADRYLYGERIDSSTAGYLRTHPKILASVEDADLDATLPLYILEGLGPGDTLAQDGTTSSGSTASGTSVTVSHTVGVGSDQILVVRVANLGTPSITTIRYGGRDLTWLKGSKDGYEVGIAYLVAPPQGTANVVVGLGETTRAEVVVSSYNGVNQKTPFGTAVAAAASSATPSVTVTTATGERVLDIGVAVGSVTATVGASQTEEVNASVGGDRFFASYQAGSAGGVMSWGLSAPAAWRTIAAPLKPVTNTPFIYVLNGRYGYKLKGGGAYTLSGTKDFGAGAQCGRPELFESAHYIPLGATVDAQKLTAFGAGNETTDTFAAITGIKADAFCAVQDGLTAKLARALANKVDLSSDGADWSGDDFECGDTTFRITDLLPAPGEILVIRPDGPRRFNTSGVSLEVLGFFARNAGADVTQGSNSHGHGPYSYWVDASGIWRIHGDGAIPIGPEAQPDFSPVALDGETFPFTAGQWRSVTAIGRWLYATHYSSAGGIDGDLFYGYLAGDGTVERWHGSLYDSDKPLRVQRLSTPALVIVEGKPGDADTPAIRIMELEQDGSPRTRLDGQRAAVPATDETSEHFAIMPGLDWGWLGFADREKQLARIGFRTQGMVTGSSWQMRMWRDSNTQQTVGAAVSSDGFSEVEPATPGTNDGFYELFVAPYCTLTASFAGGDPRLAPGLVVEARLAATITAELEIRRGSPAPNIGYEEALSNLRKLSAGARIAAIAPERTNSLNVHVTAVAEEQVGDPSGSEFGYLFTLQMESFDLEAGAA